MEWEIAMTEDIIIRKLRLEKKKVNTVHRSGEMYGLTSTFHHVSAVFGSS
jgi:hypothetical protein